MQNDKVWFITGCSTGFGRELAKMVLDRGYPAVVTARDPAKAEDVVKGRENRALVLELDVTNPVEVEAATKSAEKRFGRIDVLVNNAGIGYFAAVEESDEQEVRRMFEAYRERRAWLVPALNRIKGFCCLDPDGAFYLFPEVKAFFGKAGIVDSQSFADFLLDRARVAVVPGIAFGSDDHVRISYATSLERIKEGVKRIDAALRKL